MKTNITFDIHTHTHYSDGKGTVAGNAASARAKGLVLGISEHGPGHPWYGVPRRKLPALLAEIAALEPHQSEDGRALSVLRGIEGNLMSAEGATDLDNLPALDYYLMGHHKGVFPKSFFSVSLKLLSLRDMPAARARKTDALIAAMDDPRLDVITHPDAYIPVDMARLAEAAAKKGVLLEINQRHPLPAEDARAALDAGAHFILSSDAHRSELVGVVDKALRTVDEAGIPASRIINSPEYEWTGAMRLERLKSQLLGQ